MGCAVSWRQRVLRLCDGRHVHCVAQPKPRSKTQAKKPLKSESIRFRDSQTEEGRPTATLRCYDVMSPVWQSQHPVPYAFGSADAEDRQRDGSATSTFWSIGQKHANSPCDVHATAL